MLEYYLCIWLQHSISWPEPSLLLVILLQYSMLTLSVVVYTAVMNICTCQETLAHFSHRSTVKAANKKFISFVSFENITFIYRTFQVWAWTLLDKRSTGEEYVLRLTDSIYKLVTWCVGHVVLIVSRSHLIFDRARALSSWK